MKLRDLTLHEPAPSLPAGAPPALARNAALPAAAAVETFSVVLGLTGADTSRTRLSACNRIVPLMPRAQKMRRNVEAWLIAFALDGDVRLLVSPPAEESLRHLVFFPEPFRRLVGEFGIVRSPALGLTGMIAPRAVESARADLSASAGPDSIVPFFEHGNGDWDVFTDAAGRVGCYAVAAPGWTHGLR